MSLRRSIRLLQQRGVPGNIGNSPPGGPYAYFPQKAMDHWLADLEAEKARSMRAAPWQALEDQIAEDKLTPRERALRKQKRIQEEEAAFHRRRDQRDAAAAAAADAAEGDASTSSGGIEVGMRRGPGLDRFQRKQQQPEAAAPAAAATAATTETRHAPPRPKDSDYSHGDHVHHKWLDLVGSKPAIPLKGRDPRYHTPFPELREEEPEEPAESKSRSTQQQQQTPQAQPQRRVSSKSGVQFFRASALGESTKDPFIEAFTSSKASKPQPPPSAAVHPFETPEQRMEALQKQKEREEEEDRATALPKVDTKQSSRSVSASASSSGSESGSESGPTVSEALRERMAQFAESSVAGADASDFAALDPEGATPSGAGGAHHVGGHSVAEWKSKIKRIRARGEGNLVVRIQGEMGYAHILSQTGREADAEEALLVGEYVWRKLDELRHASPGSDGGTHGIVINICSAMRRAGTTLRRADVSRTWEQRLNESTKRMQDRMQYVGGADRAPRSVDPEGRTSGARKHVVNANSMWMGLRNPLMDNWAFAKKHIPANPDKGPRYSTGRAATEKWGVEDTDEAQQSRWNQIKSQMPGFGK